MIISNITDASQEARWDQYVHDHPNAVGYHLVAWRHVITDSFDHQTFYSMAQDSTGEVRGVLPLVFLKSRLFGRFLVSVPYLNYGGVLASTSDAESNLLHHASELARQLRASHVELRHVGDCDLRWPRKDHKVSMRLDLPPLYSDLMKAFPSKLRSQVRRGEKEGMTTEIGGLHLVNE